MLYVPINIFSACEVVSWDEPVLEIKCLAQGHITALTVVFEPETSLSRLQHSITELRCSPNMFLHRCMYASKVGDLCRLAINCHLVMIFFSQILGVPRHTKRFESLITFDSSNICCLLFLLINVLYIEIFDFISSHENARFSFQKRGSKFLVYTVFTSMASVTPRYALQA